MALLGWGSSEEHAVPSTTTEAEKTAVSGMNKTGLVSPIRGTKPVSMLMPSGQCVDGSPPNECAQECLDDGIDETSLDISSKSDIANELPQNKELAAESRQSDSTQLPGDWQATPRRIKTRSSNSSIGQKELSLSPKRQRKTQTASMELPGSQEAGGDMQKKEKLGGRKGHSPDKAKKRGKLKRTRKNSSSDTASKSSEEPAVNQLPPSSKEGKNESAEPTYEGPNLPEDTELERQRHVYLKLLAEKDSDIVRLNSQCKQLASEYTAEVERGKLSNAKVLEQMGTLENALEKSRKELNSAKQKETQQSEQLQTAAGEIKSQRDELTHARTENTELKTTISTLQKKLEKHRDDADKIKELKVDISRLKETSENQHQRLRSEFSGCHETIGRITSGVKQEVNKSKEKAHQIQSYYNSSLNSLKKGADSSAKSLVLRTENKLKQNDEHIRSLTLYRENVELQLSNQRLFGSDIGCIFKNIIENTGCAENQAHHTFEEQFLKLYPDITGFDRNSSDVGIQKLQDLILNLKTSLIASIKSDPNGVQANMTMLNATLQDVLKGTQNIRASWDQCDEVQKLVKEKEAILQNNEKLLAEMAKKNEVSLQVHESRFTGLTKQIQDLREIERALLESLRLEKNFSEKLKTSMQEQDKLIFNLRTQSDKQEEQIVTSAAQLKNVLGNMSQKITADDIRTRNTGITPLQYERLGIDRIDELSLVELQNTLKNILMMLRIPFDKWSRRLPMIVIYMSHERMAFVKFANRLYYQFHLEKIPLGPFSKDAYDQLLKKKDQKLVTHQLTATLDELCDRIIARL
ncbi:Cnm67 protein [Maudiozyma humilis]|uniref:Cnm67 protein n=1 Tax=Maudiozyma humilis TaxID=51915 RepID=A0AAV5RWW1_MAUHU|nr:Cnm67 protein [Kazachstania humilis]